MVRCLPPAPGSRGGGWTPLRLTSLIRWYSASAITGLASGDPLALWPDSASSPANAVQATTSRKPTYLDNQVNGHAAVSFDGVDDTMAFTATNLGTANTGFMVVRFTSLHTPGSLIDYVVGTNSSGYQLAIDAGTLFYNAGSTVSESQALAINTWYILAVRRTGTAVEFFLDGAQAGSTQISGTNFDLITSVLGSRDNGTSVLDGKLAESLQFNTALSDDEMFLVWNYLNGRYQVY